MWTCDAPAWRRLFYGLIGVYALLILWTYADYGITTDEPLHVAYGEHIARWYASGFTDETVFAASNLWLYGGLFDTAVYLLKRVVPLDVYDLRHLLCAFVGLLGVVGAYRVGAALGGPRAGFLAALFLILTPRYYGHAFNNTKDIPFAVGYLWSLYYLIRGLRELPDLSAGWMVKMGVALGVTLGIRASGVVLLGYLGLFYGLRFFRATDRHNRAQAGLRVFLRLVGVGGVAYLTVLPVYPWLQAHPLTGIRDSVSAFASFPEVHYVFFEGEYIAGNALPEHYAFKWFLITLPEFVFLGWAAGVGCAAARKTGRWRLDLRVGLTGFAAVFPLVYGAVAGVPLLNAIRHLTFVLPPLVVLGAVGTSAGIARLSNPRAVWALAGATAGALVLALAEMVALHPNQYVYFNRVFGGGAGRASARYETDYWNNSHKQGIRWVERRMGGENPGRKVRIGSLYKNVRYMVDTTGYGFTMEPETADFYLGNTWFDHHRAIPGEVLHIVRAGGAPLLYIVRPDSSYREDALFSRSSLMHSRLGDSYRSRGDLEAALASYDRALTHLAHGMKSTWLDSSGVYHKMGNIQLALGRYEAAMETYGKIPKRDLYAGSIASNTGAYFGRRGDSTQMLRWFEKAVEIDPGFYEARISLANIYLAFADTSRSAGMLVEAAAIQPANADRQRQVGVFLYRLGRYEDAKACFLRSIRNRPDPAEDYYSLGLTLFALRDDTGARAAFEETLSLSPNHAGARESLGTVCMRLEDYGAAAEAFSRALERAPDQADLYVALGAACILLKRYARAREALDRALALVPDHPVAREYHRRLEAVFP